MLRTEVDRAHMALAYLLVVLAASARRGRRLGMILSLVCFLGFNFFLSPSFYTFVIHDPHDWGVLITFLITGAVAAQLLYRARMEAQVAREPAEEIDRLSTLGAETLNAARAGERIGLGAMLLWMVGVRALRAEGVASLSARGSSPSAPIGFLRPFSSL
jgi:two-component system, OmpR family, sensor histidine kinase KdpD